MSNFSKVWKRFTTWSAANGLPLIWIRDPVTKIPSVSLTLMVMTFVCCILGLINTIAKSKWLGDLDETSAFNLFMATTGLYFGRKLTTPSGATLDPNTTTTDTTTTTNTSTNKDNKDDPKSTLPSSLP